MAICLYFLSNSCRFGSKCLNDHVDIRGMIKSEIDAAIKGNQWPLSGFGPFKEKPSIPNLIDDQSFEEIRFMFNEAKMQNTIPNHQMQLMQQINDSKSKMLSLASLNQDVLNIIIGIYNGQDAPQMQQDQNSGNPFASNIQATPAANPTSIFGNSSFGASPAGSQFGNNSGTSIFGGGTTATAVPNQAQTSIFGTSNTNAFASPNTSIFGKPTQPVSSSQNIFGLPALGQQQQQQQQQQQKSNNLFRSPSVFGGATNSIFGTMAVQPQQQQQPQLQQTNQNSMFGGGFGQPQQSMFASPSTQQPAQNMYQAAQPVGTPFGVAVGQNPSVIASTPFGQAQQPLAMQQQPQQPQQTNNIFTTQFQQTASPFAPTPQPLQQIQQPPPQTNPFQAPQMGFQTNTNTSVHSNIHSKAENLTKEQLDAFQADHFEIGKIPTIPPPKEYCV